MLINSGVARIVCGDGQTSMPQEEFTVATQMLKEAGVELEMRNGYSRSGPD